MTRAAGPRLEGYTLLAAAGLVAALALRRPELAAVSAPLVLLLALGVTLARDPHARAELELASERTLEGNTVAVELHVEAERAVDRLEVLLDLPPDVEVVSADNATAIRLGPDEDQSLTFELRCRRWGLYEVGEVEVRARDVLRIVAWEERLRLGKRLKAYPRQESVRRLLTPLETQARAGSEVARTKGEGIEYADLRDYVPGDRMRAINWRASARRNALVVNERHPERNTDIVLFVDSFSDVTGGGRSTLESAVRAAAALASRYLEHRDRVGLVTFGGMLRWLQPGLGTVQRYRLIESLLETGIEPTYVWRNLNVVPGRILPSKALVVALTPLVDPRFVSALQDLRARGYDLAVVEIDPVRMITPGRTKSDHLAHRLWVLERETLRARLLRLGIAVAGWEEGMPLQVALEEVRTFRRYARLARV